VGETGLGVYLDFREAIQRMGEQVVREKYGNLFDMYQRITDENPSKVPMRIFPAVHYTMGGLWVDYNLMSNLPGLFVAGEANFSDHGANRLGASALMQGLADGYFILPATLANYLAQTKQPAVHPSDPACVAAQQEVTERTKKLLSVGGNKCGMGRNANGLREALQKIPALREEFWRNVNVVGTNEEYNTALEKAGRVADFLEFAELMCLDALEREESCGGHFREEHQTPEGEAKRDDEKFAHVAAWEYKGEGQKPVRNVEPLTFEYVHPAQRSYK
jgi:succinate dehydrogenase / fumarate reductase flavoprotein subunit